MGYLFHHWTPFYCNSLSSPCSGEDLNKIPQNSDKHIWCNLSVNKKIVDESWHHTDTVAKIIHQITSYIRCAQNIPNTFLILSCTPFYSQKSLNSLRNGLHKVLKAFHRDAGTCWLQCFPQLAQLAGCPYVGVPFLIHTGNCWAWKTQQRCSSLHKPVRLAPTTIPRSKALKYFFLPIYPLNGTPTKSMSQLSQGLKILL